MKVNNSKTRLLCISDSLASVSEGYIVDAAGDRIDQSEDMKLLGFHLGPRPTVSAHIRALLKRMRTRLWVLRHLRETGFTKEELVRTYKVIIRPVHDYMSAVYDPMMTDEHDEQVERLQSQALKSIFGWKLPYAELRARADLTTLRQRSLELCGKFAEKCAKSTRFGHWFPLRGGGCRSGRIAPDKYVEEFARCERLRNSPLFYKRRNGKPGKQYGKRNSTYRD